MVQFEIKSLKHVLKKRMYFNVDQIVKKLERKKTQKSEKDQGKNEVI